MEDTGNAGCLCGAVRLQIDGAPAAILQCHCTDCQKSTGGGAVLVALVPKAQARCVKGTPKGFSVTGESGETVRRRFCGDCGSPLYAELGKYPDHLVIKAGAWDVDQGFRPQTAVWTASAPAWHHIPDDIPTNPGARQ